MQRTDLDNIINELAYNSSTEALRNLIKMYHMRLYRYIGMYVRDTDAVSELVSDVFYSIWQQKTELLVVNNFEGYLFRMAKYKALNFLRKRNLNTVNIDEIPVELYVDTVSSPEDNVIKIEDVQELNNAIEMLPPKCKLAFKLVREDGFSHKEAADFLSISVKTLEVHLTRAMHKIRSVIESQRQKEAKLKEKHTSGEEIS